MRKTKLWVLILASVLPLSIWAQHYGNAVGLRLGNNDDYRTLGATYKHRISKELTLEGILQTNFGTTTLLHGLVEIHEPLLTRRLNYFVGAGLSFGNEGRLAIDPNQNNTITEIAVSTLGTDLVAGLELTMLKYSVSIDFKPNFNLVGRDTWYEPQVGVSVRKVLTTGAEYNKQLREKDRAKKQKLKEAKRDQRRENIRNFLGRDS
jgi:hypothetical protein